MELLIAIVIFGLGFAYFATQNAASVVIHLANYAFTIPVYGVVIISLLIGLVISLIFSLIENLSVGLTLWGKENRINADRKQIAVLNQHIHDLEIENAKLKGEEEELRNESRSHKPSVSYA